MSSLHIGETIEIVIIMFMFSTVSYSVGFFVVDVVVFVVAVVFRTR